MWSTKEAQSNGAQAAGTMKLNPRGVALARASFPANWLLVIFSATVLSTSASPVTLQTEMNHATALQMGMNHAEEFVVAQAMGGQIADLTKQFPEEKDRKLRAGFLEELLIGTLPGFKQNRKGVRIFGAIIDMPIDLSNAQIPCDVILAKCQFNFQVSLAQANFVGALSLNGSRFEAANFAGMKVQGNADFSNARFEGTTVFSFAFADIAGNFVMQSVTFQPKASALFLGLKVRGYALFKDAVFEGRWISAMPTSPCLIYRTLRGPSSLSQSRRKE